MKVKRIHIFWYDNRNMMLTIFQHGPDESVGEIGVYLQENRIPHTIIGLFESEEVPHEIPSQLIILGGQMSVNDTEIYPFLSAEKKIIRTMVTAGHPVLGICLGAQMIASAFGGKVYPDMQERGWCNLDCRKDNQSFRFPEFRNVFHWHNETFDLPAGAELLVSGDRVRNQVFRLGSAVGVQFHPEITYPIIVRWTETLEKSTRTVVLDQSKDLLGDNAKRCHDLIQGLLTGWQ
jgi:GMP synthase-like glutamine amidotransferase